MKYLADCTNFKYLYISWLWARCIVKYCRSHSWTKCMLYSLSWFAIFSHIFSFLYRLSFSICLIHKKWNVLMVHGYLIFVVVYLLFLFVEMGFLMSNLSLTYPNNWGSCFFVAAGLDLLSQDRYINHIINVTGASVVLRGKGLECSGTIVSDGTTFILQSILFFLLLLFYFLNTE